MVILYILIFEKSNLDYIMIYENRAVKDLAQDRFLELNLILSLFK